MRIGFSNFSSLTTANALSRTSTAIARSLDRLSSGKRINSARDDAAGFSVATQLSAQSRGLGQATRNINEALSLVQVADSALSAQMDLVQRMREIAVQGANGSLSAADRASLNTELQTLLEQYHQTVSATAFNEHSLLDGSLGEINSQIGANSGENFSFEIENAHANQTFLKTVGLGTFASPQTTYTNSASTTHVVTEDFDNDGNLDFVSNSTSGLISVHLGNGDGTFSSAQTIASSNSHNLVTADFNSDGILDLATRYLGSDVDVHLGLGDGTFSNVRTFSIGGTALTASSLITGDFNGDQKVDLATYSASSAWIEILHGAGDGTFTYAACIASVGSGNYLQAGDLNDDDIDDLIITHGGAYDYVSVFFGTQGGAPIASSTYTVGNNALMSKLGDIDNDGDLDIISTAALDSQISVLLNDGVGGFGTRTTYSGGAGNRLDLGDLNNDGNLDVMTSDVGGNLSVFLGTGNGSLSARTTIATLTASTHVYAADFTNDGVLDLMASHSGTYVSFYQAQTAAQSALADVTVASQSKSEKLIGILDTALAHLTDYRASLAVTHNRLDSQASLNLLTSETLEEARSKVEDADIAEETAELVRNQVLQQAQVAIMAQANLQAQVVLNLLRFL